MAIKAKTKGQKKRGPKKKLNVARTASGQISRAKDPINQVALDARARMYGVSKEIAGNPDLVTYLGRLHMAYQRWRKHGGDTQQPAQSLSTVQYWGLLTYQQLHNEHLKCIGAPGAYYEPYLGNSGDEGAHERWVDSVKSRYKAARDAIQEAQNHDRTHNLWAALDLCVLQEQDLPHMVGSLRTLGNVLGRHFKWG